MTRSIFKTAILIGAFYLSFHLAVPSAFATGSVHIRLKVKSETNVLADSLVTLPDSCSVTAFNTGTSTSFQSPKAICALEQAQADGLIQSYQASDWGWGLSLDGINGLENTADWSLSWSLRVNNSQAQTGIASLDLADGDELLLSYGPWPMEPLSVSLSTSTAVVGTPVLIQVRSWDDASAIFRDFSGPSTISIDDSDFTAASGTLSWTPNLAKPYLISAQAQGKAKSDPLSFTVLSEPMINIRLRIATESENLLQAELALPASCQVLDKLGASHDFSGYKAVCALEQAKENGLIGSYQVTDWGWGFSLDGINGLLNADDWSRSWNLRLNNESAQSGIDSLTLQNGDELLLAFGAYPMAPLALSLPTGTMSANSPIRIQAQAWDDAAARFSDWNGTSTFEINSESFETVSGTLLWTASASGSYAIIVSSPGKAISLPLTLNVPGASSTSGTGTPSQDTTGSSGGGGSGPIAHNNLDTGNAGRFLALNQNADGSFGSARFFSDWAAIALAALNTESGALAKVKAYLLTDADPGALTADYERRAMALSALGINPYTGTKTDYIQKISASFDGRQIGDSSLANDDIFGLLVLLKSGFGPNEEIIKSSAAFILDSQFNGSWGSVDLTSAAIQSLLLLKSAGILDNSLSSRVDSALRNAFIYLHSSQRSDGSFDGNTISTSWAVQALVANGENEANWEKNGQRPDDFLYARQQADGGLDDVSLDLNSRLWSTSYALPAGLHKPWNGILKQFSKPAASLSGSSAGQASTTLQTDPEYTATTSATSTVSQTDLNPDEFDLAQEASTTEPEIATGSQAGIMPVLFKAKPFLTSSPAPKAMKLAIAQTNPNPKAKAEVRGLKVRTAQKDVAPEKQPAPTDQNASQTKPDIVNESPNPPVTTPKIPESNSHSGTDKRLSYLFGSAAILTGLYLGLRFFKHML